MTINWDFIEELEGKGVTVGYVPKDGDGKPEGQSGVTIASGVDLGQRTVPQIWGWNLPPRTTAALTPYADMKGDDAVTALESLPLAINWFEAAKIDACVRGEFEHVVSERWNSKSGATPNGAPPWNQLTDRQQTVVMSVAWQYGTPWQRCPRFWTSATSGKWGNVVAELRDFGDRYPTRREKEADYLEKSRIL